MTSDCIWPIATQFSSPPCLFTPVPGLNVQKGGGRQMGLKSDLIPSTEKVPQFETCKYVLPSEEPTAAGFFKSCFFVHVKKTNWDALI